jgi:predicted Zn-dependent protease
MKKKKKNIEEVLARAEKLFAHGNFPLAKKEFEKAQKKLKREDIAEKIRICRKEAETLKGR